MKVISFGLLCMAVLIGGCGTLGQSPASTETASPRQAGSNAATGSEAKNKMQLSTMSPDHELSTLPKMSDQLSPFENAPDAIIKLDPTTGQLSAGMDAKLASIAAETAKDDRLLVRLESFVPNSASSALAIGIAERALHRVRERLLGFGVQPRRIVMSSFGGEHDQRRDAHQHWVDIYLIQPGGYPVTQPAAKGTP